MTELLEFSGAKGYLLLMMGMVGAVPALACLVLGAFTRAFRPALLLAGLTLGLGVAALQVGALGRLMDIQGSFRAVVHADPADRMTILAGAKREAQASLTLGALVGVPLMLLAVGAMGAAFARTGGAR